jgi:hypothetical protein
MTVSVAGRLVPRVTALSDTARIVLCLINGGVEWLEWAIFHPRARYHFESEEALVAAVQVGLYATPLLWLPAAGLLVGPAKLMTLHRHDLRILARAKEEGPRLRDILDRYRLATQAELAEVRPRLERLTGKPQPLLQGMTFDDQLDIYAILEREAWSLEDDRYGEAARFAAGRAQTPHEFADYFRAYLHYVAKDPHLPRSPDARMRKVGDSIDLLLPFLFEALDCPRIESGVADWEVAEAINEWLAMGRRLGFSRLSQGAEQVIANTDFARRDDDQEVPRIAAAYLAGAQALLGSGELGHRHLGQDGVSWTYVVRSDAEEALVTLGREGVIALAIFRALPEEPAAPNDRKRRK